MQNTRIPDDVFAQLQEFEKKYGIIWIRPTQSDSITKLMWRIKRLFDVQRRFRPASQKSLMEYHRANKLADDALKVFKKKPQKQKPAGAKPDTVALTVQGPMTEEGTDVKA